MSAQHTPRPWHVSPLADRGLYGNRGELAVIGPDERICSVDLVTPAKRGQEYTAVCPIRDANARLIAAAPELLDALRVATEELVYFVNFAARQAEFQGDIEAGEMAVKCARAAIAKATGDA